LCPPILAEEPSVEDYLRFLLDEISGLPDMFSGVNGNFAIAAIEGALAMAGDSIDLDVVWGVATEGDADVLLAGSDVQRVAWSVSKKWWHPFSYSYVLSVICTKQEEVLVYFDVLLWSRDSYLLLLPLRPRWKKKKLPRISPLRLFTAAAQKKWLILRLWESGRRNNLSLVLLMTLKLYATALLMMLKIRKEWTCDFGVCVVGLCDILFV
jgi:hypothetical protein